MRVISLISCGLFCILSALSVFLIDKGIELYFVLPISSIFFFVVAILTSKEKFILERSNSDIEYDAIRMEYFGKYDIKTRVNSLMAYIGCVVLVGATLYVCHRELEYVLVPVHFYYLLTIMIMLAVPDIMRMGIYLRYLFILIFVVIAFPAISLAVEFLSFEKSFENNAVWWISMAGLILVHYASKIISKFFTKVSPTIY